MLTLNNFEEQINSQVVTRGRHYYEDGNVNELSHPSESVWQATVYGTEEYDVIIQLDGERILSSHCSCPYDLGNYCKHEVAVLFAIREERKNGQKPRAQTSSKTLPSQSLEEILSGLDKKTLVQIISEQAAHDAELKAMLLANYATQVDATTKNSYKKLIRQALRSGEDKYGFIDYRSTMQVMRGVYSLLYQADDLVKQNQSTRAIPIAQAAIEVLVPTLQQADDSNGEIGGGIEHSFILLQEAAPKLPQDQQHELFDYCLQESQGKAYEGWDFKWQFLEITASLVRTADEQKKLFEKLDILAKSQKDDFMSKYAQERAAKIKLSVFEKLGKHEEIEGFLQKHLELDDIRKIVIEQRLQQRKFEEAKKLCKDGIILADAHHWPGLVDQYQRILLDIAQKQNDTSEIKQLAEELFLSNDDFTYYDLLKTTIPQNKWPSYLEKLIVKMNNGKGYRTDSYTLAKIYAKEKMIDKLMSLVKKYGSIDILKEYQPYLENKYKDEIAEIYKKEVYKMLAYTTGRGTYIEACEYLIQLKHLGKAEEVKEMKQEFQNRYKNRRALLEELERI